MMIGVYVICILLLPLIYVYRRHCRRSPGFPVLPSLPILGSIPFLPKEYRQDGRLHIPKLFHHLAKTHGRIFEIHLGPLRTVVISEPELLRKVFKLEAVSHRPSLRPFHEFRYGSPDGSQRGLILSSGSEWREQRTFCLRELSKLGFGRCSMEASLLEEIDSLIKDLSRDSGSPISLNFRMNIPIINAFWALVSGERLPLGDERLISLARAVDEVMKQAEVASLWALLSPGTFKAFSSRFKAGNEAFEGIRRFVIPMIQRHEVKFQEENLHDFTDMYLNEMKRPSSPSSFNYESLDTVLIDLFLGGSETTAISLIWAVLFLLQHPEVQQRLHEELDNVLGRDPERKLSLSDRERLPYLNAFLQETMRVASIVPIGVPHLVTEDVNLSDEGIWLQKGTQVFGNIVHIHHDPFLWENPHSFIPERFLNEKGEFMPHSNKCIPFSVGRRFCLGKALAEKELYLFAGNLLHHFTFSPKENSALPNTNFEKDDENRAFIRYAPLYEVILTNRLSGISAGMNL